LPLTRHDIGCSVDFAGFARITRHFARAGKLFAARGGDRVDRSPRSQMPRDQPTPRSICARNGKVGVCGAMEQAPDSPLDRAAERRDDLSFLEARLADRATLLLPVWRGEPLLRNGELAFVRATEAATLLDGMGELVFLGMLNGEACFAVDVSWLETLAAAAALSGSTAGDLRMALRSMPASQAELALYARAMLLWHERHPFCSVCGKRTHARRGGHLRVCENAACATQHFPRTDPCVLVLVTDADRCLLGRSKGWPKGMYSALAGFVEPGETLEQAAAREVLEETGVQIADLRYTGSQSWPFPASMMVGFVAAARSREIEVDEAELESARWVSRQELRERAELGFFIPPRSAMAGRMIEDFLAQQD
jgi:NAD+ diphosphatase